jgi:hypothetical protein
LLVLAGVLGSDRSINSERLLGSKISIDSERLLGR